MANQVDLETLQSWQGKTETLRDSLDVNHVNEVAATLNYQRDLKQGTPLPHLWHWAFFRPTARTSVLDVDGHPHRGGFLPPVALPRRMWAGGRLTFGPPLTVGEEIVRKSTILRVEGKAGRSGQLVFVTVRHQYVCREELCVTEEQDIVYREAAPQSNSLSKAVTEAPLVAQDEPEWSDTVEVSTALLFRYSAVTFNTHRIHYDKEYTVEQEGYSGLVVHGPLAATLMLGHLVERVGHERVAGFSFKGVRPLIARNTMKICGSPGQQGQTLLWVEDEYGQRTMDGVADLAS